MRAIGGFLTELVGVFLAGVIGFFAMLVLAAGAVLAWLIGCVSGLFLLIALAEPVWWLHTHSHYAAVTALGYYGYAAGTFALIPVLFFLKEKLTGWPEGRKLPPKAPYSRKPWPVCCEAWTRSRTRLRV